MQKTLEGMNLKWGDVVSDIMGKASSMILHSIANGESDPVHLAGLAVGRVCASLAELEVALTGTISLHHWFLLREHLIQIEHLEAAVERITAEIVRRFAPPELLGDGKCEEVNANEHEQEGSSQGLPLLPESKHRLN